MSSTTCGTPIAASSNSRRLRARLPHGLSLSSVQARLIATDAPA